VRVIRKIQARIELLSQAGDVRDEEIIPQVPIEEKEDPLSQIINDVNKHWGVDFGPDQQKTLNTMSEELAMDESLQNVVYNNPFPNSELEFKNIFKDKVDDQFDSDEKLWQQLMNNPELNKYIEKKMFRYVADKILALREE
jgi:type I restriction enzyme R subunit